MNTAHYYQTTGLTADQKRRALKNAISQEQAITELFCKGGRYTPSQVHYILTRSRIISPKTPITSLRRAMNTLTKENILNKTADTKEGDFGAPEHFWELKQTISYNLFNQLS